MNRRDAVSRFFLVALASLAPARLFAARTSAPIPEPANDGWETLESPYPLGGPVEFTSAHRAEYFVTVSGSGPQFTHTLRYIRHPNDRIEWLPSR